MTGAPSRDGPYRSAFDLPSFVEMSAQLTGIKLLSYVLRGKQRNDLKALEGRFRYIGETVDSFYALLGPRHWVFHDKLPLDEVSRSLGRAPEDAEKELVTIHRDGDWLDSWVRWIRRSEMEPRMPLLQKALADYRAGRYYAATLVLITVMDGFVNDVDKDARKGLHARAAEEMAAWDSVAGHHMGLTNVMPVYRKQFRATSDDPVYEVHRHGIIHGNLTNYDNIVVATKAWDYLFAVVDWAEARDRQKESPVSQPSLPELLAGHQELQEQKRTITAWQPHSVDLADGLETPDSLAAAAGAFLEAWRTGNYGCMAGTLQSKTLKTEGTQAPRRMRDIFATYPLESCVLKRLDYVAPAIGVVHADLVVSRRCYRSQSRWVFEDEAGDPRVHGAEAGRWVRVSEGPEGFLS